MPEPDYARIAYEAYAVRYNLLPVTSLPCWEEVPQVLKDAWEAAIDAAFNAQIPGDAP